MDKYFYKIYNESCFDTINRLIEENQRIKVVLTSPPYNTSRKSRNDPYMQRYENHIDILSDEEYINQTVKLFEGFDRILAENGVILYNMSYSTEKSMLMYETVYNIFKRTNFRLVDTIVWKKQNAIPDNRSSNRLTRIVEYVYVFCRESEMRTFQCNKELLSVSKGGVNVYHPIFNFIEAKNNDGSNKLNKATYSTELCEKLLNIYGKENDVIYDPYIGIGTTAKAAMNLNMNCIGSEISEAQTKYAIESLKAN